MSTSSDTRTTPTAAVGGIQSGLPGLADSLLSPHSHAETLHLARTLDAVASGLVDTAARLRSGSSPEGEALRTVIVSEQVRQVDALDLEPIVFKLMHPEPDVEGLCLARADRDVALYRCFLKLCVLHPEARLVPTRQVDNVWHTHLLDTAKYRADCQQVFGFVLDHFPYFGLGGQEDRQAWRRDFTQTRRLFREHFGVEAGGQAAASVCASHGNGADCCADDGDPRSGRPRPRRGQDAV